MFTFGRPLTWLLAVLFLSACTNQDPAPAAQPGAITGPDFSSHTQRYRCAGGSELEIAYLQLPNGLAFAALHHAGRTHLMQYRPTATGARYVGLDEQAGLRWHSMGEQGCLAFLAADHTAREQVLLADCRALNR